MTHDIHNDRDAPLPEALRFELRALRRDVPPATDLWPSIAARLAATPQAQVRPAPRRAHWRRLAPLATAASLALALGLGWQLRPVQAPTPVAQVPLRAAANMPLVSREAEAMTIEYQAALKVIDTSAPAAPPASPALQVLDQSAAQIRTALARNPESRFLLDRLQRTYTRRLELTQRLAAQDTLAS
jgi:hypothetical protein